MITRNAIIGIAVLLAGLAAGYFISGLAHGILQETSSYLPVYYSIEEIPAASVATFSTLYKDSEEKFQSVLEEGQNAIREAARRKQVLKESQDRVTENNKAYQQLIVQADREVELRRLLDYYTQFYMHYYRWLESADTRSAVQFKLALGQFKATLDYIMKAQEENPVLSEMESEELIRTLEIAENTGRSVRWARVVVVILLFLLLMGIPGLIRDSGIKRFAGTLYFDSLFRPNRISDLSRWHSINRVALVLLLIYLFSFVLCSSFVSWKIPLVMGVLGLLPPLVLIALSGPRGRYLTLLLSFLAPKIPILILVLVPVAMRGPDFLWHMIWSSEIFRIIFISLLFLLLFRKLHLNTILARKWSHRNRYGSAAMVGIALGIQVMAAGAFMYMRGPELSLASLNGELQILPSFLMGSPAMLLKWMQISAGILTISSLSVFIFNRRRVRMPLKRI